MKKIIVIFFTICISCNNVKIHKNECLSIRNLKQPNCNGYSVDSLIKQNKKITLFVRTNNELYYPLSEREYLFYNLINLNKCIRTNLAEIDSIVCYFNYNKQKGRKVRFSYSIRETLHQLELRDSVNAPYYRIMIEKLINDDDYLDLTMNLSYTLGKVVYGENYSFYDNLDFWEFLLEVNKELIEKKNNNYPSLLIINKMENNIQQKMEDTIIKKKVLKFLMFIEELYKNDVIPI